jgi:hypothetical protein
MDLEYNISIITLILALIQVESSGVDSAIGDNGASWGCLQMQAAYVQDAAEHANENWTHKDALNRDKAISIFTAYMDRYATEKRLGRKPTAQDIARIHNGGPNGHLKVATEKYWVKVKAQLISSGAINATAKNK